MSEFVAIVISIATLVTHTIGAVLALRSVMISRTPQAAIGWGIGLLVFPLVTIPLFLVFGESRFSGYTLAGTGGNRDLDAALERTQRALKPFQAHLSEKYSDAEQLALNLRGLPPTRGNSCRLLVDGEETFSAIFSAIDEAKSYLVVQFYIVHDDTLGRKLKERMIAARRRGARCWLMYDKVGAKGLPDSYVEELQAAGVAVHAFVTDRQFGRRFQINFRNHRKLVVADGRVAFFGGLNAGDEYMGKGPLGAWRDTHAQVHGPAVQALQFSFLEDWHFASGEVLDLPLEPVVSGSQVVMPFASGPAEAWNVTPAVYGEIIHDVRRRLWIASPYLVPDSSLRTALAHAALRGVDVRIILPKGIDHLMPWLSSYTFYPAMRAAGVKIYRYQPGFMHQKVLLADDDLAIVGSVNLDYRSFMLNFEMASVVNDKTFAAEVEKMFDADFARCLPEDLGMFENAGYFFRLKCRLAALMSPEQ